jgi:hypothetical protein
MYFENWMKGRHLWDLREENLNGFLFGMKKGKVHKTE